MEKQEVLQNIEYNNRLIRGLQSDLYHYQDRLSSIQREEKHTNQKISDFDAQIRNLRNKKEDIEKIKKRIESLYSEYEEKQRARMALLNRVNARPIRQNFMKSYLNQMNELIKGREAHSALDGLREAINKTQNEFIHMQNEIENCQNDKNNLLRAIEDLHRQYSRTQSMISDVNSQLRYRRNRLEYWKNILRSMN